MNLVYPEIFLKLWYSVHVFTLGDRELIISTYPMSQNPERSSEAVIWQWMLLIG